jgi:hypothetical protein
MGAQPKRNKAMTNTNDNNLNSLNGLANYLSTPDVMLNSLAPEEIIPVSQQIKDLIADNSTSLEAIGLMEVISIIGSYCKSISLVSIDEECACGTNVDDCDCPPYDCEMWINLKVVSSSNVWSQDDEEVTVRFSRGSCGGWDYSEVEDLVNNIV